MGFGAQSAPGRAAKIFFGFSCHFPIKKWIFVTHPPHICFAFGNARAGTTKSSSCATTFSISPFLAKHSKLDGIDLSAHLCKPWQQATLQLERERDVRRVMIFLGAVLVPERLLDITGINAGFLSLLLRLSAADMLNGVTCDAGNTRDGVQLLEASALRLLANAVDLETRILRVHLVGVGGGDEQRQPLPLKSREDGAARRRAAYSERL